MTFLLCMALFGWLAASHSTVLFSHIISASATSSIFLSQQITISQPNEAYVDVSLCVISHGLLLVQV
jgi:hypothetical protein